MFAFVVLAGIAHHGQSSPLFIGIVLVVGLIIWVAGKIFSK
jgi:hypothetical protein